MTTDFYNLLLTDCALAAVLLALFLYVGRVSRGVRGIATWGVAHFLYSLGAAMLDGTAQELARAGDDSLAHWTAGLGGLLACAGLPEDTYRKRLDEIIDIIIGILEGTFTAPGQGG